MKLQDIEFFVQAVKCESFTKASELLYTSQSNISKGIASIERELKYPLFVRNNKGSVPTPQAIALADRLENLLLNLKGLMTEPSESIDNGLDDISLRVGITVNMSMKKITPAFRSLDLDNYMRQGRISFFSYQINEVVRRVLEGDVDLAFVYSIENLNFPNLNKIVLTNQKPRIYYSRSMFSKDSRDISLNDFSKVSFVLPQIENSIYDANLDFSFGYNTVTYVNASEINFYVKSGMYATILGCSQMLQEDPAISYIVHTETPNSAGMIAIWCAGNKNPLLHRVLTTLVAVT